MLISKTDSEGIEESSSPQKEDHSHEYQTASELFELMTRDHNFNNNDMLSILERFKDNEKNIWKDREMAEEKEMGKDDDLSTRDLIILYKNIDIGTKLMTNVNELNNVRKPNQLVETIYAADPESDNSETSDIYTSEDINNVFTINKERIDLLNNKPSYEHRLCHKLGDLEIQPSRLSTEYDKYFLFQDPYIKQQIKSMNLMSTENCLERPVLPVSLLDYICCKRLEDNYNFYLDNIICYVKHTIEQLKRISNGDYLTEKAKAKWKEVENARNYHNNKVLATSTSIPLHVERKSSGHVSSWDDIVHSEIDVRSLSKILEKKIVLEVPKLICGTYKLFSKRRADNLIISCKRKKSKYIEDDTEPRVDVVLQLQRSESGQVMSNISSIMILQAAPINQQDSYPPEPLPLPYIEPEKEKNICEEKKVKIIEIDKNDSTAYKDCENKASKEINDDSVRYHESSSLDSNEYMCSENEGDSSYIQEFSESGDALRDILDKKEALITNTRNIISSDELRLKMQRLDMQSSLPEESNEDLSPGVSESMFKKKSAARVRIKSPYENKSHALEENKRKKLLEIKEKRERKKMSLGGSCKISKHYGRSATLPHYSNSVTKLSITNKSFYNSIYGQNVPLESKPFKGKPKNINKNNIIPEISLNGAEGDYEQSLETPDNNRKKYIDRCYYLDEAETEMMYLKTKQKNNGNPKDLGSASTSAVSDDFRTNLTLLSQLISPSESDLYSNKDATSASTKKSSTGKYELKIEEEKKYTRPLGLIMTKSSIKMAPANTSKDVQLVDNKQPKKTSSAVECRESIDQIYDLIKQFKKSDLSDDKSLKGESTNLKTDKIVTIAARDSSTVQGSDSGTSLKHYQTSSVPSCCSFDKTNVKSNTEKSSPRKKLETHAAVIPKVIINTKFQARTIDKVKKDKRVVTDLTIKAPENPLKAISQLLHEFENVRKTKQKSTEPKAPKKVETPSVDVKSGSRQNYLRRSRVEQNLDADFDRVKKLTPSQRNPRAPSTEIPKITHHPINMEGKCNKLFGKKLTDIIDRAKEARGEAVRGPSKFPSRLNALSQPKRSYIQAHSEEYHSQYRRNLMANRLQRLATNSIPAQRPSGSASSKNRVKRSEAITAVSIKHSPPAPPLDRAITTRYSVNNPIRKTAATPAVVPSCKYNVPSAPENLKRMVAVESYVNNHFGRAPAAGDTLQHAQKSRVPLLPIAIDLAPEISNNFPEESTKVGSKLHRIIYSMINANTPSLAVLSESLETNFKYSRNNTEDSLSGNLFQEDEHVTMDSDHQIDIFQDKNIKTAVNDAQNLKTMEETVVDATSTMKHCLKPFNSSSELPKLENALYRRMSVGAFPKKLRIKNLTLSPKQSLRQIFALQSGDAGSLIAKTTISQHVKINKDESFCELKSFSVLSKTRLDWRFASFPMQITTVGYSFPNYKKTECTSSSKILSLEDFTKNQVEDDYFHFTTSTSDEMSRYTRGCAQSDEKEFGQVDILMSQNVLHDYDVKTKGCENVESKSVEISSADFKTPSSDIKEHTKPVNNIATCANTLEHLDDVDYTASLDILVGLLNEMQKITSCQIVNADNDNPQRKDLQTILNNAAALESSTRDNFCEPISISSLNDLKQLQSSPCIYTYYLSKNENISGDMRSKENSYEDLKPLTVDKEVSVDLLDGEYVTNFTDVPSRLFPITLNHSTNVTNSLLGVLSEPSSQSIFSFAEYQTYGITSFECSKKVIELPNLRKTDESHHSLVPYEQAKKEKIREKSCLDLFTPDDTSKKVNTQQFILDNRMSIVNMCHGSDEFDPLMKMKRDILVTFYSILVFTVFAALSFPELMYNV